MSKRIVVESYPGPVDLDDAERTPGPLDALIREVGEWGLATFPDSTLESISRHLGEEAREVLEAAVRLEEAKPVNGQWAATEWMALSEEMADVLLLLLHLCHRERIDVVGEARAKFERIRHRRYVYDPELGYAKRVKEVSE